jgi:hypothetical protein
MGRGQEEIEPWPAHLRGSEARYCVVEHDQRFGSPTFDPFEAAQKGFDHLSRVNI